MTIQTIELNGQIDQLRRELVEAREQIALLTKERKRLAHAIDPMSETDRLERSVESLEQWLKGERDAAEAEVERLKPSISSDAPRFGGREVSERWDRHFLELSVYHSLMSKDPSTCVGSVIVGPDREILSAGFNGFPRGIADTPERLADREMKLKLIVHAEMNALLAAARTGMRLKGCTLYLAATDDSGLVWGGPPCTRCTVEIIQVGISEIVSYPIKSVPSRWHEDLKLAHSLIAEVGIKYRELPVLP